MESDKDIVKVPHTEMPGSHSCCFLKGYQRVRRVRGLTNLELRGSYFIKGKKTKDWNNCPRPPSHIESNTFDLKLVE